MKKITKVTVCVILFVASVLMLVACTGSIGIDAKILALNELESDSEAALFSYERTGGGNLFACKSRENFEKVGMDDFCAIYNSDLYVVGVAESDREDMRFSIYVYAMDSDGKIKKSVNLGSFGPNNHDRGVVTTLFFEYSQCYESGYFASSPDDENILSKYYDFGIVSKYYDGCIYARDILRCVKYDIANDTVFEVSKEEENTVFERKYSYTVSDDFASATVENLQTGDTRVITLDSIAKCSEEFAKIVEQLSKMNVILETRSRADRAFENFVLREIDGQLFVTVHLYSFSGFQIPVLFEYHFEDNTFELCAAGDSNTSSLPIAVLN